MKNTVPNLKSMVVVLILFLSLISCETSNKVEFEFYTSNISICRMNIYNSLDSLQAIVLDDKKFKESKRIRRNEISLQINEKNIDKLVNAIQHECEISCKKILKQSDLSSDFKDKNLELKLLIKYSK